MRPLILGALALLFVAVTGSGTSAEPPAALGPVTGDVVWVDFWASWCVPCRRSFPWLNSMQGKYGAQGLQIIGVNVDKERGLADAFLAEIPARFAVIFDPAGELAKQFGVQAMPSSYLLDARGNVIARHFGFRIAETQDYEQAIRSALASASVDEEVTP